MSAKGSLKHARDPKFQALFAVRGVSANVFKMSLDQIVGPKGNKEFTDLITVMGCNVGSKFDLSKLQYNKIIIASDADVDGLFIRSLLMAFFFKLYPEIIQDGRLFIAEPPLYRVDDKKDPFVINKEDYIARYVKAASKDYKLGYPAIIKEKNGTSYDYDTLEYLNKSQWTDFLSSTSSYVDEMELLVDHYKINDRLLELILEQFAAMLYNHETNKVDSSKIHLAVEVFHKNSYMIQNILGASFPEMYYDEKSHLIKGVIDGKFQLIEISTSLIHKASELISILGRWGFPQYESFVLRDNKTGTEHRLSMLGVLKILKKYQPDILHRFKGLGENDDDDIRTTIMDPNTRTLIRVNISDIENDMKVFQVLRGNSPQDSFNRKMMMKKFKISKDAIDT